VREAVGRACVKRGWWEHCWGRGDQRHTSDRAGAPCEGRRGALYNKVWGCTTRCGDRRCNTVCRQADPGIHAPAALCLSGGHACMRWCDLQCVSCSRDRRAGPARVKLTLTTRPRHHRATTRSATQTGACSPRLAARLDTSHLGDTSRDRSPSRAGHDGAGVQDVPGRQPRVRVRHLPRARSGCRRHYQQGNAPGIGGRPRGAPGGGPTHPRTPRRPSRAGTARRTCSTAREQRRGRDPACKLTRSTCDRVAASLARRRGLTAPASRPPQGQHRRGLARAAPPHHRPAHRGRRLLRQLRHRARLEIREPPRRRPIPAPIPRQPPADRPPPPPPPPPQISAAEESQRYKEGKVGGSSGAVPAPPPAAAPAGRPARLVRRAPARSPAA
jgi:hypothetical protein